MACLCEKIAGKDIDLSPTCIGHLWIFQNLDPEELEALSREALRKKSATGQALFMQGDPTDEMFLIKGGRVKLSKVLEDGTELMLDIRKAGDFVGESMFFEEGQYPVSAVCLEDTLTCGFTRSQFEKLVLQHPTIGLQVNKTLSERISWPTNHVGIRIEDRLYRVLCNVAKELRAQSPQGVVIQFPLTH
jgi:CRP/FNR family transcriptional regulator